MTATPQEPTPNSAATDATTWQAMQRTAVAVRAAAPGAEEDDPARLQVGKLPALARIALVRTAAVSLALGLMVSSSMVGSQPVSADGGADNVLFSLTNQDRASNGVPALRYNGALAGIGEATPYRVCGITVAGRSADMIQRNYFSHPIPPCGQLVFVLMQEAGIRYQSAGENIGWVSGLPNGSGAAGYINGQFMASPDHRSNILNRNYTDVGMGSATSGAGAWSGGGAPQTNAWMFSEEFAQLGSPAPAPPPAPAPAPPPQRQPQPQPLAPRNSQAPPAPQVPPATTDGPAASSAAATPTAVPTAAPDPSPNPFSSGVLATGDTTPPLIWDQGGLLSDSVESVLETYLIG